MTRTEKGLERRFLGMREAGKRFHGSGADHSHIAFTAFHLIQLCDTAPTGQYAVALVLSDPLALGPGPATQPS